ncbi:myb-related transcription factor, partner of profilin-like [Protopterus annectens]|uniref:myb-related transcription factor, partner of profilin-like n=1 Tax=Protopterus annectens TaxID=7888 RepID=UPI001CFBDA2F|nr:myb-related transcription factor, partner of profilin-like [Protopterus annectens]
MVKCIPVTLNLFLVFVSLIWKDFCWVTDAFARYYKTEKMTEESPKRRKANFNEAETEMLVEEVLKHEGVLFGTGPTRISPGQKRKIWESIMRKINVVAACPRDVEDLKKRWRDLKRRDRERVSRISWSIQSSGSDPHSVEDFSMKDERFFTSFHPDIVPTVGGIDTLEFASNSSGQGGLMDIAGSSHQSFHQDDMDLKEELDLEIVKQEVSVDEETVGLPSHEPQLSISTPTASVIASLPSRGHKRKGSYKAHPFPNQADYTEDELLQLQQQQTEAIQAGFDSINQNLGILQQGLYDLGSSLSLVAQTLVEIKNIYVKNNTNRDCTEASTQTGPLDYQDSLKCSSVDDKEIRVKAKQ